MDFFKEQKKLFGIISVVTIILLLIISTLFVVFPQKTREIMSYVTYPIQTGINNIKQFSNSVNTDLIAENEELKAEIEKLKLDNSRVEQLDQDNQELSALLGAKQKFSQYDTVAARKIGQDFNNWNNVFIIDKGINDGIKEDMIVISQGGLVGKIVSVTPFTANVATILDESSSVSVVSTRSNDIAFVNGDLSLIGTNTCRLDYLDSSTPIFINDELFTSSISSLYPPGISIGYVSDINTDSNNEKTATVTPIVDFDNLNTVLVITEQFSGASNTPITTTETVTNTSADTKTEE